MLSTAFKLYGALASLLLFFVPCISLILFIFTIRGFVPAIGVSDWDHWYSFASAGMLSVALAPVWFRLFKVENKMKDRLLAVAMIVFTPVFAAALSHLFIVGPFAYALHSLSSPQEASVVEKVQSASTGDKSCRNKLSLTGSKLFFQRAVCGIRAQEIDLWRSGGLVELFGRQSAYGFQVERYRYVNG